jgi:signal transduction histidine kinase
MIHPEDRDAFSDVVRAAIERAERVAFEGRVVLPGQEERWIEIIGQPMPTPDTGDRSFFGTARDITERKRAEQILREADARKDVFLATLAHELRNPLAPIVAATRILGTPQAPAEAVGASRAIIARQVKHMAALLDDLLDISRVSRGKLELKRGPLDVASALDEAIESAQPLLAAKGHHLEYTPLDPPVQIVADRMRLIQVMTNLLTNAAKYTDEGGRITLHGTLDEDGLRLGVRDNGIGISAATLPRVFDMFTQVGDSPLKAEGGLGIGLALARGIVQLHGGRLEAFSAGLGCGSEFLLWLPRSLVLAGTIATEVTGSGASPRSSRPRAVLIADDNRDAVTSLAYILSLAGHRVFTASSGREALACIARNRPDAMVLDIGMPDVSGYEIAQRVRQQPWSASTTLIAVTGFGQDGDRRQALAAGFDHHLTKPIDPAALEAILVAEPA